MYESFLYHPEQGLKCDVSPDEMREALRDERSLIWVDMTEIDDVDIDLLTMAFNIHPLTTEDFIMPNARPKIENFGGYIYLIMFALESSNGKKTSRVNTKELDFCLGRNFLITFHDQPITAVAMCKERIKKQSPTITNGADMLLYSVLDTCVDTYLPIITEFDNMVDEMSDALFKEPDQRTLHKIYDLKNEVIHLRRTIGPQTDVISLIVRGDFQFISPGNIIYFRNIQDNLARLNDAVGASRDVIAGAMEAYVSIVSNRLNEIMKTLTVITTIMMPLTLIASVYGMNFKHMPELESKFGYPMVITIMAIVTTIMLVYFRRRKWL
ncbi:MAG: magnesium/cobalt transporter CorA [Candidatus Omnitrophota bacterium]